MSMDESLNHASTAADLLVHWRGISPNEKAFLVEVSLPHPRRNSGLCYPTR
jgi:hypothetical protein